LGAVSLAKMGAWVDTWGVMYEPSHATERPIGSPSKRLLVMAVLAPFGVIALMASPLLIDTIRQLGGI
jgi:hypothetical protein